MKKVLLTLGFIGAVAIANAQISKGTIMLGGTLDFSSSGGSTKGGGVTVDKAGSSSFTIAPMGAYYLTDNIAIGLGIGYGMTSSGPDTMETTGSSFAIGPMVRYNMPLADKFGAFVQAGLSISSGSSSTKAGTVTVDGPKTSGMDFAIEPGLLYFISDRIAIEATYGRIGYNTSTSKTGTGASEVTDTDTEFGINLSSSTLSFGFAWYFGGGK
jgi:hypothetical protein